MMSYEDLEEARAKRTAKEKAAAAKGKGKRGRKRKNPEIEMEAKAETRVEGEGEEAGPSVPNKKVRMSEVEPAKPLFPWRVPVARMY